MGSPLEHRCICCWLAVCKWVDGIPHVCKECRAKLTPGDMAAIITAMRQTELLQDIRGQLDIISRQAEGDENQLGSIAKAFENCFRTIKLPAGKANEFFNQAAALVRLLHEQAERAQERDGGGGDDGDDDDDEPWSKPWKDGD